MNLIWYTGLKPVIICSWEMKAGTVQFSPFMVTATSPLIWLLAATIACTTIYAVI